MRRWDRLMLLTAVLLSMLLSTGCSTGTKHYELTKYMGNSVAALERKSGLTLEQKSNGIYLQEDMVQVMVPDKKVTSVTLLKDAGDYTIFGIEIGMTKEEADGLLEDVFGKEIAKTVNPENSSVTYSYLKNGKELYLSCDSSEGKIVSLSYYVDDGKEKEGTKEKANAGELIAIIGKTKVYYNEAMVYLKSIQEDYEKDYDKGIWNVDISGKGKTFGSMIKDEVIHQISSLKIIRAEAGELGITLSEEEIAQANSLASEHYEGLTAEDRSRYLITEELLQQVYSDNLLANKVFETLTINVDAEVPDTKVKQITVQDILIYSTEKDAKGNRVPLSAEDKEAAYQKVKSIHEQAVMTEDFYTLAEANTQAGAIEYTFGKGSGPQNYSNVFEQAAFNLKTGEVSNIITTDYGWHILYCVSDYNEDATTQVKEAIIEERRNTLFAERYEEWVEKYEIIINREAWDSILF